MRSGALWAETSHGVTPIGQIHGSLTANTVEHMQPDGDLKPCLHSLQKLLMLCEGTFELK